MESTTTKFLTLSNDLQKARLAVEEQSPGDPYLGVGATVRVPENGKTREISVYARDISNWGMPLGVAIDFFENNQPLPNSRAVYLSTNNGVVYGDPGHENSPAVPMLGRSREFGRRALNFLNYNHSIGALVPRNEIRFIDDTFRHAISQVATYRLMDDDVPRIEIEPKKGMRLPVREFNKSLPGHTNVAHMLLRNLNPNSPPESQLLKSGLRHSIYEISDGGDYEGRVLVAIAGELADLADTKKYPNGPLLRIHSACCISEKDPKNINVNNLERDYNLLKMGSNGFIDPNLSEDHEKKCDCCEQMLKSQELIASEGGIYADFMEQEGRGYGLLNKLEFFYRLYEEEGEGFDTADICERYNIPPDIRIYSNFAKKLYAAGIRKVQLLGNNYRKAEALQAAGIEVIRRNLVIPSAGSLDYLITKGHKLGHDIPDRATLEAMIRDR